MLTFPPPPRLDVKKEQVDKGYPRYIDSLFPGVPIDANLVFQYKGKGGRRGNNIRWGPDSPPMGPLQRVSAVQVGSPGSSSLVQQAAVGRWGCSVGAAEDR